MKNIVVGILTIVVIGLMALTFMGGRAYHGGAHGKVIADFGDSMTNIETSKIDEKSDREKEDAKLNALRDKAGSTRVFEVSNAYKKKCASCHGVNGSGMQNGKAMMGPKLFGLTTEKIFKDLVDFKAGRKENVVMKGLLIKLSTEDLQAFADEIGTFPAKAEEAKSK